MTERTLILWGALSLLAGVAAGAFGAHGLRQAVSPDMLAVWQTAVLYQMVHGLGLLALAALQGRLAAGPARWAGRFMVAGILIFSGSLYVLVLSGITVLGAITPIGGVCFIVAWALVALAAWRRP